nr:hypothetical protein 4 [Actinidia virus 1]
MPGQVLPEQSVQRAFGKEGTQERVASSRIVYDVEHACYKIKKIRCDEAERSLHCKKSLKLRVKK